MFVDPAVLIAGYWRSINCQYRYTGSIFTLVEITSIVEQYTENYINLSAPHNTPSMKRETSQLKNK